MVHRRKGWYTEERLVHRRNRLYRFSQMVGTQMKQIKLILTDGWYTEEKVGTQRKQIILILTDGWYTDEKD